MTIRIPHFVAIPSPWWEWVLAVLVWCGVGVAVARVMVG